MIATNTNGTHSMGHCFHAFLAFFGSVVLVFATPAIAEPFTVPSTARQAELMQSFNETFQIGNTRTRGQNEKTFVQLIAVIDAELQGEVRSEMMYCMVLKAIEGCRYANDTDQLRRLLGILRNQFGVQDETTVIQAVISFLTDCPSRKSLELVCRF